MKKNTDYKLEEHCYVLLDLDKIHDITYVRHKFIWYPERGMSLTEQRLYIPYVQSVVTESPWIIASYPSENVRIWDTEDDRGWISPSRNTYGGCIHTIMNDLLAVDSTIPSMILDGGKSAHRKISRIKSSY